MKKLSDWRNIGEKPNHKGAAVYQIRLVCQHDKPVCIERFLGNDDRGILCIGSTNNIKQRISQFESAIRTGKGQHSEGNLMHLVQKFHSFKKKYKNYTFQYQDKCLGKKSDKKAKKEEEKLIKKYVKKFGEVPPLNSAIPNRKGSWSSY